MKGEFTIKILEKLSEAAVDAGDLMAAFVESGYGVSLSSVRYRKNQAERRRLDAAKEREERRRLARRYNNLIAWLRRDGLIVEEKKIGRRIFKITRRGMKKLKMLLRRKEDSLPAIDYPVSKSHNFTVIAFDVPEKEKRKRWWLRAALRGMGFTMLQRSVWIGKVKIPREFIDDLSGLRLVESVEILEITKAGSLRHLV